MKKYWSALSLTILPFLFIIILSEAGYAQTISGTINSYAKVSGITGNQFTLASHGFASGDDLTVFDPGRKVLVYQAKGASINISDDDNFGQVTNWNNAGHYEIATIQSRNNNTITFSNLQKSYDTEGLVQIVSIPQYGNVSTTGDITASSWDYNNGFGGIIILEANTLTLSANITANAKGFKGGSRSSGNSGNSELIYYSDNTIYGSKGEGLSTFRQGQTITGQAPLANGGGGGSLHNGGGGGGANYGGGGQGGKGWPQPLNTTVHAGGFGGINYDYSTNSDRIFFGGGGGGAQQNNNLGSQGGKGGGIVILLVNTLSCTHDCIISAAGENAANAAGNDGAGGGGAGGSILISTRSYNPNGNTITINIDGGNGGNIPSSDTHGGGGGGGAGVFFSSIKTPTELTVSGNTGTTGQDNTSGSVSGTTGAGPATPQGKVEEPQIVDPSSQWGPGGVNTELTGWFVSHSDYVFTNDDLTGNITDNGNPKSWKNIANNTNYLTQGSEWRTQKISFTTEQLNGHSTVQLKDGTRQLISKYDMEAQTIIVVTDPDNNNKHLAGLVGFSNDKGIRTGTKNDWNGDDNNGEWWENGNSYINGTVSKLHNTQPHIVFQKRSASNTNSFYVGGYFTDRGYNGKIAEVIAYRDALSSTEQQKVETYLAIKYGITLVNKNYIDSEGNIIWNASTNSAYHHDVAGIGRNDVSLLDQRKSKSINNSAIVTIANGNSISSPAAFGEDRSFQIWGHNNSSSNSFSRNIYGQSGDFTGINRIWKVSKQGNIGNTRLQIAKGDLPPNGMTSLFISNTTDFPNNITSKRIPLVPNGANWEATASFNSGEYFTFGRLNPVLSNIETTSLSYCQGETQVTNSILLTDEDSDQTAAIITVSNGFVNGEDKLIYTSVNGINQEATSNSQTIRLPYASKANMTAALKSIVYQNTAIASNRTSARSITISFTVGDGFGNSNTVSREITVNPLPQPIGIFFE